MTDSTHWEAFRDLQKAVELVAGKAAHIPVTIRYVDTGLTDKGTILLMHGIPTWGYLYHAVILLLVDAGYRVIAHDFLLYLRTLSFLPAVSHHLVALTHGQHPYESPEGSHNVYYVK